ncbi:hypothetical protein ACIO1C_31600 [Streptomyces sp. NPDC087420]|uniref:hypothetical protein n=1 Tax=Streptomyces sp. NPDC087420 TaxID=3365785 RepID=UPI003838C512
MPLFALVIATFGLGLEQLVQWRFGPMGIVALILLSIGIKAKNPTCTGIGAVVLALLVMQPGL